MPGRQMEASALMAIARYRSIPFGEVVMAGDSLAGREWEHRGWMTAELCAPGSCPPRPQTPRSR